MKNMSYKVILLGLGLGLLSAGCEYHNYAPDELRRLEDRLDQMDAQQSSETQPAADVQPIVPSSFNQETASGAEAGVAAPQGPETEPSTADGVTGDAPAEAAPPPPSSEDTPVHCSVKLVLDNFPGIFRCGEAGHQDDCEEAISGRPLRCPGGLPEGVAPLPDGLACTAWTAKAGLDHRDIFQCSEGYCVDASTRQRMDCPFVFLR